MQLDKFKLKLLENLLYSKNTLLPEKLDELVRHRFTIIKKWGNNYTYKLIGVNGRQKRIDRIMQSKIHEIGLDKNYSKEMRTYLTLLNHTHSTFTIYYHDDCGYTEPHNYKKNLTKDA